MTPTTELAQPWCDDCPDAAIVVVRGEGYCGSHDPQRVQLTMTLGQARRLTQWLQQVRAMGMTDDDAIDLLVTLTDVVTA